MRLSFERDGQEEGSSRINVEGGRHNQVLGRLQREDFDHLTSIQVGLTLGGRVMAVEERGWELSLVCLVL